MSNIVNKGTNAGGSNTNKTGLSYEDFTDINENYELISKHKNYNNIKFKISDKQFISIKKSQLLKYKKPNITPGHGCKQPDECYISEIDKNIFIIEKKFQQTNGSVCEKIQTGIFKKKIYEKMYPNYNIIYIYCLSEWFKTNCSVEINILEDHNIPIFWGNDENYKSKIIDFIINYK